MTNGATSPWTRELEQLLREGWAAGKTGSEIGTIVGMTRSAVLRKARHLNLARRADVKPDGRPPKPRLSASPPSPNSQPHGQGCRLIHLTSATCRWPIGEPHDLGFFFCGHPGADNQNGRPYCAYHARIAYQPAKREAA